MKNEAIGAPTTLQAIFLVKNSLTGYRLPMPCRNLSEIVRFAGDLIVVVRLGSRAMTLI